jgi:2-methylisocitrate lyase-like PEP mutase family enzyme
MTDAAVKAELLRSFHVPGSPLILTNVWDAESARVVAAANGTRALATASHTISDRHGVPDGEGLSLDQALAAAAAITEAVAMPVSVDFERGYAKDPDALAENVRRLIEVGAAGLNIEDSYGSGAGEVYSLDDQVARVAAVRKASENGGVPLSINARVDVLRRGGTFEEAIERANAYLEAGGDSAFVLGLDTEAQVEQAVDAIDGPVATVVKFGSIPIARLVELGIARISVGPGSGKFSLEALGKLAETLNARGEYPPELTY